MSDVATALLQLIGRAEPTADPALAAVKLARATIDALILRLGQTIDAKVTAQLAGGLTQLTSGGETFVLKLETPLPVNTAVTLKITPTPTGQPAVTVTVQPQSPAAQPAPPVPLSVPSLPQPIAATPPAIAPVSPPTAQPIATTPPPSSPQPAAPTPAPPTAPPVATATRVPVQPQVQPSTVATQTSTPLPTATAQPVAPPSPVATTPIPAAQPVPLAPAPAAPAATSPLVPTPPAATPNAPSPPAPATAVAQPAPTSAPAPVPAPSIPAASSPVTANPTPPAPPMPQSAVASTPVSVTVASTPLAATIAPQSAPAASPAPQPAAPATLPPQPATIAQPPTPLAAAPRAPASPPLTQILADPVQAAARQDSVLPLIARLTTLAAPTAATLPRPALEAIAMLLSTRLDLNRAPPDGKAIRDAMLRAGVITEPGTRTLADAKSALLQLRSALSGFLGGEVEAVAPVTRRPPPPLKGEPVRAPSAQPSPPLSDQPVETARQLLGHADAALSRTKLLQLASNPTDAARPNIAAPAAEFRVEVPMQLGAETGILQLLVERDGKHKRTPAERGWRMRFALNFTATGEVGAEIALLGRAANVALWAADPATADALEAMLPELAPALARHGLDVGAVRVRRGAPQPVARAPGQLLDSAR